jgi:NodT family efflux transporter outer membrane factor (OMF) lipoprotein
MPIFERRLITISVLGWLLLACGGCRVGPNYHRYDPAVGDLWHQQLTAGTYADPQELNEWWQAWNDPVLEYLISQGDLNNRQLYQAVRRIERSRAQREVARSAAFPRIAQVSSYRTNREGADALALNSSGQQRIFDDWKIGLSSSWELDLFGQIYRQTEAAEANRQIEVENYRDLLVSLHAEIAESYLLVQVLQQRMAIVRRNVAIQEQALELAKIRLQAGTVPKLDLHQAELNLARTASKIPDLEKAIGQTLNSLDLLLGQSPGTVHDLILITEMGLPELDDSLPVVLPLDMIRQRPDIRAAERRVAANTALVGATTAELYPHFTLLGNFALNADQFSSVFNGTSLAYSVGPSIRWALFESGRIRWNIAAQRAETEQAVAGYEQTILQALQQVENALIGIEKERARRDELARAVSAARHASVDVHRLYQCGRTDFQNVLDTDTILFQTENELVLSQGNIILETISLYRALGGGWQRMTNDPRCHRARITPFFQNENESLVEAIQQLQTPESSQQDSIENSVENFVDESVKKSAGKSLIGPPVRISPAGETQRKEPAHQQPLTKPAVSSTILGPAPIDSELLAPTNSDAISSRKKVIDERTKPSDRADHHE